MADPWDNVRTYLCRRYFQFILMFALGILGIILNTVAIRYVEPKTITAGVIQVNYIGLIALVLFSGGILAMCRSEM